MMRVTNKMLVNELNRSLANNLLRMDKYQRQLSTSRKINTPSDDPAGLVKSLRLRTNLVEGEQYLANINEVLGFLDTTDAAFGNINEILHDARELAVKAATDSNAKPADFAAIAKNIRELNEQLKMIANSTYGSKYIFGGSNVTEIPFENDKWWGNSEALAAEIGVGVVIPYNIDVREFFIGRLDELQVNSASGINADKIEGKNLQEGNYEVNYGCGVCCEVENKLNAVDNKGSFFFYNTAGGTKTASLVGSNTEGTMGSPYEGYIEFEVKTVHLSNDPDINLRNTLEVDIKGRLAIGNGEYQDIDIKGQSLDMAALDGKEILKINAAALEAAGLSGATRDLVLWNNSGQALAGVNAANPPFARGDSAKIKLTAVADTAQEVNKELGSSNNNGMFFFYNSTAVGNPPQAASLAAGSAVNATNSPYHGYLEMEIAAGGVNFPLANLLTVDISGQLAIGNGAYQNIALSNVTLQMDAAAGGAICSIPATALGGAATDPPLVLWNNSGLPLAGIGSSPEFEDGDKVGIQLSLPLAASSASESQSYLSAVPNAGSFFYESMGIEATLGVGAGSGSLTMANGLPRPLANDAPYSGSLLIEAKKVDLGNAEVGPRMIDVNTAAAAATYQTTISLSRDLYMKDNNGNLTPISDNTDLKDYFNYQRENGDSVSGAISSAIYDADSKQITLTYNTAIQNGDSVSWNNDWDAQASPNPVTVPESGQAKLYDQYGNEFQRVDSTGKENLPMQITCNAAAPPPPGSPPAWTYEDKYESAKITVDIKGHLYTRDGKYKYVELENIVIDSETARNEKIFKISAAEINDPNFTEDLVIWNNGADCLGGIDLNSPQIKVGDKTVISIARQGDTDSQNVDINFNYKAADGTIVEGSQNMKFANAALDYDTAELNFFTLNEETGLAYSGEIELETGVFEARDAAATFTWIDGLFGYMDDLARKIEAGKVSETSLQIGGNDSRMEELLLYRSTLGARVNRLELQQSRLETIQVTFTELLSKTEDADMAEVIMQLQLQENVYRASLAAGARIIQPSLLDFLR